MPSQRTKKQLIKKVGYCKNCGKFLSTTQNYCAACGAIRIHNRLTFKNLAADFGERFFNLENVFFKTFAALFTKPEDVIDGYITGVRKKYMSAFGYFGVAITLAGLYLFLFRNFFENDFFSVFFQDDVSQSAQSVDLIKNMIEKVQDYQSIITFLTIPILAITSKLIFINYKKYNYIEHVVIFLYVYSHYSIITSLITIGTSMFPFVNITVSMILQMAVIFYTAYVLKRLYEISIKKIAIKTLIFFIIFPIILFLFVLFTGAIVYILGWTDQYKEMIKS